jgi:hypothetical protein
MFSTSDLGGPKQRCSVCNRQRIGYSSDGWLRQRCQPSRPTAGDGGPSQFLPGRTGRRRNRPSRPSMSMTARRPGTGRGRYKPRPRQSSTVPGRHRAVRVYTWIKPNEALIACSKIYKYRDALYLCIKPLCKSESKDK